MKVQFELTIGENKFTLSEDVETHADFFKKLDFYSALPKTGPNGETDLVLRHRKAKTKDGKPCDYYSIVSKKANQEYRFGQSQGVNGQLFPKGWEPLFTRDGAEEDGETQQPSGGLGAAAAQSVPQGAKPAGFGLGTPAAKPASAPTPTPAAAIAPAASPANAAPQVKQQAANVLSKFGI